MTDASIAKEDTADRERSGRIVREPANFDQGQAFGEAEISTSREPTWLGAPLS